MSPTTKPCPADQAAPVRRPVSLAEIAMAQGVRPEFVGAWLRSQALHMSGLRRAA